MSVKPLAILDDSGADRRVMAAEIFAQQRERKARFALIVQDAAGEMISLEPSRYLAGAGTIADH